jgi:hypothetical protein
MATESRTEGRPANQMDTQPQMRTERYDPRADAQPIGPQVQEIRPAGDETRGWLKTTEFWVYLPAVAGVLIASYRVGVQPSTVSP